MVSAFFNLVAYFSLSDKKYETEICPHRSSPSGGSHPLSGAGREIFKPFPHHSLSALLPHGVLHQEGAVSGSHQQCEMQKSIACRSAAFRLRADSLWTRGTEISGGILLRDCPLCTAEKSAVSLCTAHLYPLDGGGCADALWSVYPLPEKGNLPLPIREKYHRYLYPAPPV